MTSNLPTTQSATPYALAQMPEVHSGLTMIERQIMSVSALVKIADIAEDEVARKLTSMCDFIAIDMGYNTATASNWKYTKARIFDIVRKYFSDMTLGEIKLAFELASIGELDTYLPEGNTKHYGQFGAEYFAKILRAYKAKQVDVVAKVYKLTPKPEKKVTPEENKKIANYFVRRCVGVFLRYKYTGRLYGDNELDVLGRVYEWLVSAGYAERVTPSEHDRKLAFIDFKKRVRAGWENEHKAVQVIRHWQTAQELNEPAETIARDKEIKRAFDEMIKDEVQVWETLKYQS